MFEGLVLLGLAIVYVGALFIVAAIGERAFRRPNSDLGRPLIYALSLAVYCTSWTFFGSVGLAATTGWDFVPIYIGPILLFTVARPLLLRVVRLAKSQNLTSIADFLAARYGKSQAVATVVTLLIIIGTLPYIALQLKAIIGALTALLGEPVKDLALWGGYQLDPALLTAMLLALFAILFGTRHVDATEHQDGLIVAIAAESVVKLAAFLAVGIYVTVEVFGDFGDLFIKLRANPEVLSTFTRPPSGSTWLTYIGLSFGCALLLPRQFHVAVVENKSENEIRSASWLFPIYLILINLFVVPIAIAGLILLPSGVVDADLFVLAVPMSRGAQTIAGIALIGGLSAATAMVIVETIALAIMVSNGIIVPLMLRYRMLRSRAGSGSRPRPGAAFAGVLLHIRRASIVTILVLGFGVYLLFGQFKGLVALGLLSFSAMAQLAPAFFAGLVWRKGTARGAIAGILAGFVVWGYTLILPWLARGGHVPLSIVTEGPFGWTLLRPQALFYLQFEPLAHGVLWSLSINTAVFVMVSLMRAPLPVERLQAIAFIDDHAPGVAPLPTFRIWRTTVTIADLQATVGRFLGVERTDRSFRRFASDRGQQLEPDAEVDSQTLRFAEHLLTSAIGAASARLVLALLFRRGNAGSAAALRLFDDATEAVQQNRDLLQSALDQVRHGLGVFDKDMRLICWNRQYREILALPPNLGRVGTRLDQILKSLAERGDLGRGAVDDIVADRLVRIAVNRETLQEYVGATGRTLEVRTSGLPQGGIVVTYLDVTDRVEAARLLQASNDSLETRVRERTAELDIAKHVADQANREKTRLLLGASHDLLQPLSAARLYVTTLTERPLGTPERDMVGKIDASLSSVEDIFTTLIDISKIDSGRVEPEIGTVDIQTLFDQLSVEFAPAAAMKSLRLRFVQTSLAVRSDRRLLRRILQNFVSNAIKYTPAGRVLIGVRLRGGMVAISVLDTGPGIPESKRDLIFKEFQRLDAASNNQQGLGLGLSIVERIGRVLAAPIELRSVVGRGSQFSVVLPLARGQVAAPQASSTPATVQRTNGPLEACQVLCIDNDPTILAGMSSLLSGWGCRVTMASDRDTALAAVLTMGAPPDILLVDYHLDRGTGVDVARELRYLLGLDIPTIVITADQTAEMHTALKADGFTSMRKPIRAGGLRALMTQQLMTRARAAAE